jgi:formate-dependent nitrite reductase cytochrome c552 subunit
MAQMETKYRDPESKNKLKQLKADAQKQIERNKIILKDLINKYQINNEGLLQAGQSVATMKKTTVLPYCWEEK